MTCRHMHNTQKTTHDHQKQRMMLFQNAILDTFGKPIMHHLANFIIFLHDLKMAS